MSEALLDLLFWIVIFVALFVGFRWLQKRRAEGREDEAGDE